jgi:hypothetical protein
VTRQPRAPSRTAAASPPKPLPITIACGRPPPVRAGPGAATDDGSNDRYGFTGFIGALPVDRSV